MKNRDLKYRAEAIVESKKWDRLLCFAFLELIKLQCEFGRERISEINDPELTNLSRKRFRSIKTPNRTIHTSFFSATLKGIHFEIGGSSNNIVQTPHLHGWDIRSSEFAQWDSITVSLVIEHKTALTVIYSNKACGVCAENFTLSSVEELHVSQQIGELLLGLKGVFLRREKAKEKREGDRIDRFYDHKFSLSDSEAQKDTVFHKLGKVFGKIFKN